MNLNRRGFLSTLIVAIFGPRIVKCLPSAIPAYPANLGLFGIQYYQVNGNSAYYMGIARSAFPGKFSTPSIVFPTGSFQKYIQAEKEMMAA